MSTLKVGVMIVALTGLLVLLGAVFGGAIGAGIAFSVAMAINFASFWWSDKIVIAMTRARPAGRSESPELFAIVERVAARAQVPTPKLYIVDDPQPNAFATGRSPAHGVVAVNSGLAAMLAPDEIEGVIAHEIGHIKHRDTLTMAIVAAVAGSIMMLASFARFAAIFGIGRDDDDRGNIITLLLMAILAPIAAMLIQMGISRAREYEADRIGAELAGTPDGLASALLKLEQGSKLVPSSHMPPQAAHLCIVNPLAGGGLLTLFSTHPPVAERVRRLRAMR